MFKSTGTQEASNESGIVVTVDGYVLHYRDNDHVMEFNSQPCGPSSPEYDVLFTLYFPTQLKWLAPYGNEPVSVEQGWQIEKNIVDALGVLNCQVNFTIPVSG